MILLNRKNPHVIGDHVIEVHIKLICMKTQCIALKSLVILCLTYTKMYVSFMTVSSAVKEFLQPS